MNDFWLSQKSFNKDSVSNTVPNGWNVLFAVYGMLGTCIVASNATIQALSRPNENQLIATTKEKIIMESNQQIALFTEITTEESATVSGGQIGIIVGITVGGLNAAPAAPAASTTTTGKVVNFDLNSYLFTIGAGAVFNGGVTTNVVNIGFGKALST